MHKHRHTMTYFLQHTSTRNFFNSFQAFFFGFFQAWKMIFFRHDDELDFTNESRSAAPDRSPWNLRNLCLAVITIKLQEASNEFLVLYLFCFSLHSHSHHLVVIFSFAISLQIFLIPQCGPLNRYSQFSRFDVDSRLVECLRKFSWHGKPTFQVIFSNKHGKIKKLIKIPTVSQLGIAYNLSWSLNVTLHHFAECFFTKFLTFFLPIFLQKAHRSRCRWPNVLPVF